MLITLQLVFSQMSLEMLNMTFASLKIVTSSWLHSQGSRLMPVLIGRIHTYCYILERHPALSGWNCTHVCVCSLGDTTLNQTIGTRTYCMQTMPRLPLPPPPLFLSLKYGWYGPLQNEPILEMAKLNVKYTGVSGVVSFLHIFFLLTHAIPLHTGKKASSHTEMRCPLLPEAVAFLNEEKAQCMKKEN